MTVRRSWAPVGNTERAASQAQTEVATPVAEPTFADAARELRCIVRWGLRHWPSALILSLACAALVGWQRYRRPHLFQSTVAIDVRENVLVEEGPPPSARELTRFIFTTALSDSMLVTVMRGLRYDTARLDSTRDVALSDMRDLIGLTVSHDSLAEGNDQSSARIGLSFTSSDPEAALAIARALAEHVVSFQNKGRSQSVENSKDMVVQTEQDLQERLRMSEAKLTNLSWRYSMATPTEQDALRPQIRDAEVETVQLRGHLEKAGERRRSAVLRSDFERDVSGMHYEIVDRGRLAPPKRFSRMEEGTLIAVFAFLGLLPTLVIAIGGLSFRVYDRDSLRRLGLNFFGHAASTAPFAFSEHARARLAQKGRRG